MWRLRNPVMDYAWGSPTAIPKFLGVPPSGQPVAEVWIGAHPKAPSVLVDFDGVDVPLPEALEARPELVGQSVRARYGSTLPFMVKYLAAGKPLSLQVHPDERMAVTGFADEEAAGIAMDDPQRTYKDPHHKPEVMIALAPTETLAGFRTVRDAGRLLGGLGLPWADRVVGLLDGQDMRPTFEALVDGRAWVEAREGVLSRCAEFAENDRAYALVGLLDGHFPGDSGAAAPLLLNVVRYDIGEALFVPVGQLHAHVSGFGVEVMAASDNVIRAGLTPKFVDREALFRAIDPRSSRPGLVTVGMEGLEAPGVAEFAVEVVIAGEEMGGVGPRIALAVSDAGAVVGGLALSRGEAVFVADGERGGVERGDVWVVQVPGLRMPSGSITPAKR